MYKEFIDLSNAPLDVQIAVRYMDQLVRGEICINYTGIANFFKNRSLESQLAEALTAVNYKNERILLLFQAAMYRAYKVHIPCFLKHYSENKEDRNYYWRVKDDDLNSWENRFWLDHIRTTSYDIKCTLDSVHEEKEIIANIKKLQEQCEPFVHKAEKLNKMMNNSQMKMDMNEWEKVKIVINIVERNLQGNLTAADIMDLEADMEKWNKSIANLVDFFDNMIR